MEMTPEMTPEVGDPMETGDSMEISKRDVHPLTAMATYLPNLCRDSSGLQNTLQLFLPLHHTGIQ